MLDERAVEELVIKLRARAAVDADSASDVLDVLCASYREDKGEPAREIAKTVCELLEPERVGGICWLACRICGRRIIGEEERETGVCSSCLLS